MQLHPATGSNMKSRMEHCLDLLSHPFANLTYEKEIMLLRMRTSEC